MKHIAHILKTENNAGGPVCSLTRESCAQCVHDTPGNFLNNAGRGLPYFSNRGKVAYASITLPAIFLGGCHESVKFVPLVKNHRLCESRLRMI